MYGRIKFIENKNIKKYLDYIKIGLKNENMTMQKQTRICNKWGKNEFEIMVKLS